MQDILLLNRMLIIKDELLFNDLSYKNIDYNILYKSNDLDRTNLIYAGYELYFDDDIIYNSRNKSLIGTLRDGSMVIIVIDEIKVLSIDILFRNIDPHNVNFDYNYKIIDDD